MNLKALKLSQKILLACLFIFALIITVLLVKQQQDLRNRATNTLPTAISVCNDDGKVNINLRFSNTSNTIVNVVAKDSHSGLEANLGSIEALETVGGVINTNLSTVEDGIVLFESSGGESKTASYSGLDCTSDIRTCAVTQAICKWDSVDNTTEYKVKIVNNITNEVIKEGSVSHPTTSLSFPAQPSGSYTCEVIPVNSCGEGDRDSGEGSCPAPTPTIAPSNTPDPSITPSITPTATVTPTPSSTPTPTQTITPSPTSKPGITNTPGPSNTPLPTNTPLSVSTESPNTPTAIQQLPPTGFNQDILNISIIGSTILLMGAFVLIFLW